MKSQTQKAVGELFPSFARELEELVRKTDKPELADQVPFLPVVDRCRCGDKNCAHFYTATPPKGAYGAGHSNIMLESLGDELIILDVVDERIVAVEVLDQPEVRLLLDRYLPL